MDHSELIAEMAYIEKLSTQERLKLARRRRMQQMKKNQQKERELVGSKSAKTALNERQKKREESAKNVKFISNVKLLEAAARNDIEEVEMLLSANVNPDSTNEDGLTALHQCCIDDSEEMMRLLVEHGSDVNAQDSEKWTPLHAAATCGHLHLAKFLIVKGANLLAVNADGNMPYDICEDDATLDYIESEMARRGVTQKLIDETRSATETFMLDDLRDIKSQGQSLMFRDSQSATPLHVAAANGYVRVVEYLLSQNVPTEVRDHDDWSPLHAAACWGHPDVLELLVQNGANLHARTKNQETPYDICEDAELRDRIMQLINEQETKRIQDQNKRIRRVHSNSRTQSVRRHSIREKTLTPKKEAQEEARIRLQMEDPKPKSPENSPELGLRSVKENLSEGNISPPESPTTTFPQNVISSNKTNKVISNNNNTNNSLVSNNDNVNIKERLLSSDLGSEDLEEKEDRGRENIIPEEEEEITSIPAPVPHPRSQTISLVRSSSSSPGSEVFTSPISQKVVDDVTDSAKTPPPAPPPRTSSNPSRQIDTPSRQIDTAVAAESPAVDTSIGSALISQMGEQGIISQIGEQGGSKIDIHVTVTVNPFSPGTLSDLKKQRALSRASQSSYTLQPASSTYSLSSPPPEYESHIQQHSNSSPEFNASSIRVDSVTYRPPSSPTLTPRKFCGDPNEIIGGPAESRSCCSLM